MVEGGRACAVSPRGKLRNRLRNLHKKLREVLELERRARNGIYLRPELRAKLNRKTELEAEIASWKRWAILAFRPPPPTEAPPEQSQILANSKSGKGTSARVPPPGSAATEENEFEQATTAATDSAREEISSATSSTTIVSSGSGSVAANSGLVHAAAQFGKDLTVAFHVPAQLQLCRAIGKGAYGAVAAFKDTSSGQVVAVKKVEMGPNDPVGRLRSLRELAILRCVQHPNLIRMRQHYHVGSLEGGTLYIIQELMSTDLDRLIRSRDRKIEDIHQRVFMAGILRGVAFLHSADIIHRDVKPANVLVNRQFEVKLCDFNLSRGVAPDHQNSEGLFVEGGDVGDFCAYDHTDGDISDYVCSRWWRAPEVLLLKSRYGKAMDVWSVGCILGELILRRPVFKGMSPSGQVRRITETLGSLGSQYTESKFLRDGAAKVLDKLRNMSPRNLAAMFSPAHPDAVAAIARMLSLHPRNRPTAKMALGLPYVSQFAVSACDEAGCDVVMDWSFEKQFQEQTKIQREPN